MKASFVISLEVPPGVSRAEVGVYVAKALGAPLVSCQEVLDVETPVPVYPNARYDTNIDELELSVRSHRALKAAGVTTLGALRWALDGSRPPGIPSFRTHLTTRRSRIKNIGMKSFKEIEAVMVIYKGDEKATAPEFTGGSRTEPETCRADRDGDCIWEHCPQLKDGEPRGGHCPRDTIDRSERG